MYLYLGILFIILGIVVLALGFTNIFPLLKTTGFVMVLYGGLMIGLHFVPAPETDGEEPTSFVSSIFKLFYAPAELFRSFRRHPMWIGVLIIVAIISGIYSIAFFQRLTPTVISNHTNEKLDQSGLIPPDKIANAKKQTKEVNESKLLQATYFVNMFIAYSFLAAFLGAIYMLIVLAMGGKMNYWQGVAVAAYSIFPVVLIQKSLSLLILYLKEPTEIHPLLGQSTLLMDNLSFLVSVGQRPVLYVLLASLSLTSFYGLFLTVTGLKNAGSRVTQTAALSAALIVWLIGLSLGVISAFLFGGMMS